MTHDATPPTAMRRRISAALALACATTACSVALHGSEVPTPPAPTPTIVPILAGTPTPLEPPRPSPIPRLAHLEVPADIAGDEKSPAATDASTAHPPAVAGGSVIFQRRGDLFVAPARIGGRVLGDVLLDTGAGAAFLDQRIADETQLSGIIAASPEEARGHGEASIRELHGLTIGDLTLATDRTFLVDLDGGDALIGGRLAGVIGLSALGWAPFTLDFTTGTLTVHTDAAFEPPASIEAEALRVDQGLPFVEATLADDTSVWLLLDTASSAALTVWRGFAKQHPGALRSSPNGTGPEGAVREWELRGVRLLGERHDRVPVLVQDAPMRPWQRARVVGRIGMGMLRELRITVHPATERIWVERP